MSPEPEGAVKVIGSKLTYVMSRTYLALAPEPPMDPEGAEEVVGSR